MVGPSVALSTHTARLLDFQAQRSTGHGTRDRRCHSLTRESHKTALTWLGSPGRPSRKRPEGPHFGWLWGKQQTRQVCSHSWPCTVLGNMARTWGGRGALSLDSCSSGGTVVAVEWREAEEGRLPCPVPGRPVHHLSKPVLSTSGTASGWERRASGVPADQVSAPSISLLLVCKQDWVLCTAKVAGRKRACA